eukprot:TRINITY_DN42471_c0_g1_i2.p1 TRINITY_DN42471_c0_g1~~TRINITY_DN42471_c0_g1_i2.p1  ORF type:complete len:136 (+),score=14.67 TRINITY_DN42471_c0_g1_i2:59-409(+)
MSLRQNKRDSQRNLRYGFSREKCLAARSEKKAKSEERNRKLWELLSEADAVVFPKTKKTRPSCPSVSASVISTAHPSHDSSNPLPVKPGTRQVEPTKIGRAVQQECRDRSRMPSSA